jgi:hypothetical protein
MVQEVSLNSQKISKLISHSDLCSILDYCPNKGIFTWAITDRLGFKGKIAGSLRPSGYITINFGGKYYQAHRLAWFYVTKKWPRCYIDHVNGNKSDNRIINLREANQSQNIANSKLSKANKTGYKGVSYSRKQQAYQACLGKDGKQLFLGYFDDPEEAYQAYVKAALTHHGKFAKI